MASVNGATHPPAVSSSGSSGHTKTSVAMSSSGVEKSSGVGDDAVCISSSTSTGKRDSDRGRGAGRAVDSAYLEYNSPANRFRSNVEIIEKPRQMVVLLVTIAGASYLVRMPAYS